jgi:hypothetical protein
MIDIPGDDGFELYHKIKKLDDRVKICFLKAGGNCIVKRLEMKHFRG